MAQAHATLMESQPASLTRFASESCTVNASVEGTEVVLRTQDGSLILRHNPEAAETVVAMGSLRLQARERLVFSAKCIEHRAQIVRVEAAEVNCRADRWVVRAHLLLETAHNSIRTVTQGAEVRAGRLRTVVRHAANFLAGRTTIRSKGDTAIDGKQVLLG